MNLSRNSALAINIFLLAVQASLAFFPWLNADEKGSIATFIAGVQALIAHQAYNLNADGTAATVTFKKRIVEEK